MKRLSGAGIENQPALAERVTAVEVEHVRQRAGYLVKGAATDSAGAPIVFDKAQHRALVGHRVIDKIRLGER